MPQMTRNIEAVGLRFHLLNSVLAMIQGEDNGGRHLSCNVLRERVYCCAFDYFTLPPQTPTQTPAQLRHDIKQLIRLGHHCLSL